MWRIEALMQCGCGCKFVAGSIRTKRAKSKGKDKTGLSVATSCYSLVMHTLIKQQKGQGCDSAELMPNRGEADLIVASTCYIPSVIPEVCLLRAS